MSNIMQTLVSQLRDEEADNSRGATTSAPQQRVSAKTNLPPPLQYHTAMQGRVAYHTAARGSLVYERSNSNFAGYTLALADHDEVDSSTTDDDTGYCRATAGKSSDGGSQPGLSRGASATGSGAGTYDLAEADSKATSRGGSTSSAMSDTSSTPTYVRAQPPPSMGSSNSKQSRTYDYVGDDNGAGSGDYDLACHLGLKPASSDGMPPPLELSAARTSDVDGVLYEIGASSQTSDGDNSLYAAVMSSDGSYAFGSKAATLVSNSTATSGPLCSSYAELGGRVHSVKHLAPEAQSIISMSSLFETASRLGEAGGQGIQRQTSLPSSVSTPSQGETGEYDNVED